MAGVRMSSSPSVTLGAWQPGSAISNCPRPRLLNPWYVPSLDQSMSRSRPLAFVAPPGASYQEDAFDAESVTSLAVRFFPQGLVAALARC